MAWNNEWSAADQAWVIATPSGNIYRRCGNYQQAINTMLYLHEQRVDTSAYDHFMQWKRSGGQRLIQYARDKLRWRRQTADDD